MANQQMTREVRIAMQLAEVTLEGHLTIPERSRGIVIFAHGSGSSRHSPRNRAVAKRLNEIHLASLLFDLLTEEEQTRDQFSGRLLEQRIETTRKSSQSLLVRQRTWPAYVA
jgi:putative phosphoribosyl transferase